MEFARSREIGTNCSVMSHNNARFINLLFRGTDTPNRPPAVQTRGSCCFIVDLRLHIRVPIHGNFARVSLVDKRVQYIPPARIRFGYIAPTPPPLWLLFSIYLAIVPQ